MSKHWTILLWFMWLRIDRNYIPEQADEKTKAYNLTQKSKKATNEHSIAMTFTICILFIICEFLQVSASLFHLKMNFDQYEFFMRLLHRFQKEENLYDMKSYGSSDVHHCSKVIYSQRKPLWFGKYEKCHTERWFIHLTNLNNTTFLALNCKCT